MALSYCLGEKKGRLELLKQIAYFYGSYSWPVLRNVYVSIVRKIELGSKNWNSNFMLEFQVILTKLGAGDKGSQKKSSNRDPPRKGDTEAVWYCRDYQSGKCSLSDPHTASIRGKQIQVVHICARCWRKRVRAAHPENKCTSSD